ncbi:LTA synthase family protein [Pseudobacteroides cellulosolvens]|nr:LTA synthase family protein [Pseudobacteroides cellulosolvens]
MFFHSYIHVMQFIMLFKEGFTAANQNSAPINLKMLIILIDLPGFILVYRNFHRIIDFRKSKRFLTVLVTCLSLILLAAIEVRSYYYEWSLVHLVQSKYNGEKPIVERYGTVANNVLGIYLNRNEKVIIDKLKYGEVQAGKASMKDNPNFIFIQVEAMDSNVINKKYKGSYITPFLNSLKDSSVYYPYVLSEHMGGGTSDIEFSVINSIEPLEGYSAQKLSNYNYPNSFIKVLRKNNYSAIGFHGNKGSFFNRNISFPKMGFERLIDMDDMGFKDVGWGAPDRDVLNYAFDHMTKMSRPFISYIITMTSHGPFTNAGKYYDNKIFDGVENVNIKNYFNSMSYVDKVLEDFVTRVRTKYKNTYIFIYGDHTPSIRDKEYMQASFDYDNKYFEFIPLFILTPDNRKYIENSRAVSMLDFSPTSLKASGVEYKIKSDGVNLLEFKKDWRGIKFKDMTYNRQFLYEKIEGIK